MIVSLCDLYCGSYSSTLRQTAVQFTIDLINTDILYIPETFKSKNYYLLNDYLQNHIEKHKGKK